jgi:hypothetical protein
MSFGKIQPTPNFLFHFPSSASSDRKFRNFPKRDTHKLIKCADCQLETGKELEILLVAKIHESHFQRLL